SGLVLKYGPHSKFLEVFTGHRFLLLVNAGGGFPYHFRRGLASARKSESENRGTGEAGIGESGNRGTGERKTFLAFLRFSPSPFLRFFFVISVSPFRSLMRRPVPDPP